MYSNTEFKNKVAVKYNGNLLADLPKITNIDYLVINLKGSPNLNNLQENIRIEKQQYGTKVFQDVVRILIDNVRFCTIIFNPRNTVIDSDLVQLKIENHVLYNLPLSQIKKQIENISYCLNLRIEAVSRLDICTDIENSTEIFRDLLKDILSGSKKISGRKKQLNFYTNSEKGEIKINGIGVGKKSNNRYLRIYNKSLELQEVKSKSYIVERWKEEFEDFTNVWRFEYSLNSQFLKNFNVNFEDVFSYEKIIKILQIANDGHFQIKENTGKKETNKEKTIFLFSYLEMRKKKELIIQKVRKIYLTIEQSLISVKRKIKGLLRDYYSTQNDELLKIVTYYTSKYNLKDWLFDKYDSYIKEFEKQSIYNNNQKEIILNYIK